MVLRPGEVEEVRLTSSSGAIRTRQQGDTIESVLTLAAGGGKGGESSRWKRKEGRARKEREGRSPSSSLWLNPRGVEKTFFYIDRGGGVSGPEGGGEFSPGRGVSIRS